MDCTKGDCGLVSVVVNNFNYGRFLRECIDSAIDQTYPETEIIVVDDGSTDDSRNIIASYGQRIIPVLKENGGQGSAFNAGLAVASGNIVVFLDSDDVLFPDIVRRVVDAFRSNPSLSKVQYRLAYIDESGRSLGRTEPPARWKMPSGDVRQQVIRYHEPISPPTSGNAFAISVLQRIFPVPEELFRTAADAYLNPLCAALGPVASLDEVGGRYRMHGHNDSRPQTLDLRKVRGGLAQRALVRSKQRELLSELYGMDIPDLPMADATCIRARMVSLKLDPSNHPFSDRLLPLSLRGCYASLVSSRLRWYERIISIVWFVAMAIAPTAQARALSEKFYLVEKRGFLLSKMLSALRVGR
jgi:glycosyltransferase involved in cell wall biosynthesis